MTRRLRRLQPGTPLTSTKNFLDPINALIEEVERLQVIATGGSQSYVDNANGFFAFPDNPFSRLKTFKIKSGSTLERDTAGTAARQERNADNDDWIDAGEDDYTLEGDFFRGVAFRDDIVQAYFHSGTQKWQAVGCGKFWVRGTLAADMTDGTTKTVNITVNTNALTIQVTDTIGLGTTTLGSGTNIGCQWNEDLQQWETVVGECEA